MFWRAFDKAVCTKAACGCGGRGPYANSIVGRFGAQLRRDCGERAQQPAQREKRVTEVQNSREELARESGKTRLEERPGTERLSVPTHAKVSRCKESFHAAAVTRPGGERSWICSPACPVSSSTCVCISAHTSAIGNGTRTSNSCPRTTSHL